MPYRCIEKPILQGGERLKVFAPDSPPGLRPPAQDSCIRAGCVNEQMGKALPELDPGRILRDRLRLPVAFVS